MRAAAVLAVVLLAGPACDRSGPPGPKEPAPAPVPPGGRVTGERIELDLGRLRDDFTTDEAAARIRYLGKHVEGPATLTLGSLDGPILEAEVRWDAGPKDGVRCVGYFWRSDPRNKALEGIEKGRYGTRIGGLIALVRVDPAGGPLVVELRPAWVAEGASVRSATNPRP